MNDMSKKLRTVKTIKAGKNFTCIGSECPLTCCKGWTVTLDKKTFNLYRNHDEFSKHISKKVGNETRNSKTFGTIKLKEDGNCPLQDEVGLCNVQKELGASALSKTCSTFPRLISVFPDNVYQGFTMGCPEAARLLINQPDSTDIVDAENDHSNLPRFDGSSLRRMPQSNLMVWQAVYRFVQMANDDLWARMTAIHVFFKTMEQLTIRSEQDVLVHLDRLSGALSAKGLDSDPAIFQVETLAPEMLSHVTFSNDQRSLAVAQQRAIAALDYATPGFNTHVKNFIIARDIWWKRFSQRHPQVFRNLLLNEIFSKAAVFGGSVDGVVNLLLDASIWLAYIRFMLIANAKYFGDDYTADEAALMVSQITRRINHNRKVSQQIKDALVKKFGDAGAAANLLIA